MINSINYTKLYWNHIISDGVQKIILDLMLFENFIDLFSRIYLLY